MAGFLHLPFAGPNPGWYQGYGPTSFAFEPVDPGVPGGHFHNGIDYKLACGTPLLAPAPGTVKKIGYDTASYNGGFGHYIVIDHSNDVYTLYGHTSAITASVNDVLTDWQQFGLSGGGPPQGPGTDSGNSNICHLHFSVLINGGMTFTDPAPYMLNSTSTASLAPASTTMPGNVVVYWAQQAGIPADQMPMCIAIALGESGLQINAKNFNPATATAPASYDYGLWQINNVAWAKLFKPTDFTRMLSDGQFAANCMSQISNGGRDWSPWNYNAGSGYVVTHNGVTYTNPTAYHSSFLPQANAIIAAYTNPTAAQTAPFSTSLTSQPLQTDFTDTSPQLPVQRLSIVPVRLNTASLVTVPHAAGMCLLWVKDDYIPVIDCQQTDPTYLQAGSWQATVSLDWLQRPENTHILDRLLENGPTQVTIYMGYVADVLTSTPQMLTPVFTGLLDAPDLTYQGATRTMALSGPDMSGILSTPSDTLSQLSANALNKTASKYATQLVLGHNAPGTNGLSVQATPTSTTVGEVFGSDSVKTRTSGQTEWDVIQQLAANEGYIAYFAGTTFYFQPMPPESKGAPQYLDYGLESSPASAVTQVRIRPQAHSKRDYRIVVESYARDQGYTRHVTAGNVDATSVITIDLPPGTGYKALHKRAASVAAQYAATEVLLDAEITGLVPLVTNKPIGLRSDTIYAALCYPRRVFYPVSVTRLYTWGAGLSMKLVATNRPIAIQTQDTASAAAGF